MSVKDIETMGWCVLGLPPPLGQVRQVMTFGRKWAFHHLELEELAKFKNLRAAVACNQGVAQFLLKFLYLQLQNLFKSYMFIEVSKLIWCSKFWDARISQDC